MSDQHDPTLEEAPRLVATWSPCCNMIRDGEWAPGAMHNAACRSRHAGVLGPTVRLVVHPDDLQELATYERYPREPRT